MYRTTRRVEFRDTDTAGIVHFSVFFNWMEEVEHAFLRSRGLSVLSHDEQGPISWPRVHAQCDYRAAARFEDILDVELTIERLGSRSVSYAFTFSAAGRVIASGKLVAVCCRMSESGPPQSIEIPDSLRAQLLADEPTVEAS
jgi:4-hydroxybenzoyl-CoA thioesterase/acyl-CoA thioester hydrolase